MRSGILYRIKWVALAALLLLLMGACAADKPQPDCKPVPPPEAAVRPVPPPPPPAVIDAGADGAVIFEKFIDRLMRDLTENFLDRELMMNEKRKAETRFLYSAFVGEGNFDATTPLGRMIGDALASRMQNAGFQVIEVRLSKSMRIHKKFGMLAMSQDIKRLFTEHQATFMITGSYTVTPDYVYVLAKIIGNTSQVIYASSGVWLPRTAMVNYLLDYREPTVKVVPAD